MPRPLSGDRPPVLPGETALHSWLVALIQNRLNELGWRQIDLRRATGMSGEISPVLRGLSGGGLGTWQRMIDATGATIPGGEPNNLRAFLIAVVQDGCASTRNLARRADMSESHVGKLVTGRSDGSLVSWQRLLDAAGATLPTPSAGHAVRR